GRLSLPARVAFAIGLLIVCAATAGGAKVLWRKVVAAARPTAPAPVAPSTRPVMHPPARVSARASAVEAPPDVPSTAVETPPAAEPATEPPAARDRPQPRAA